MNLLSRVPGLREAVRTNLWPLPTAAVVIAVIVGVAVPHLDAHVDSSLPPALAELLFQGNPDAARTILDAIAGSMITVTSLTFSLTVVTLQLASSQFSPRLLRTFTRDLFVQATLALFLATFTYSLTVLRGIRAGSAQSPFVPSLAVSFGFLLAVASVIGLVLFLAHLADEIRVETMLRIVHSDATETMRAHVPGPHDDSSGSADAFPDPIGGTIPIFAQASGFVVRVDAAALIEAADDSAALCVIDAFPGCSVVAGTPIGFAWYRDGRRTGEDTAVQSRFAAAVVIGHERTSEQDIGYGLRQLTDVAIKALSPGINDPTTAVHALGHSAALLCDLSERRLTAEVMVDRRGVAVARVRRPAFDDLLDVATAQPRRYGADEPAVIERLLTMLQEIAWRSRPEYRSAVRRQLDRLRPGVAGSRFDAVEQERLSDCADAVDAALRGEWRRAAAPASTQVVTGEAVSPGSGDRP